MGIPRIAPLVLVSLMVGCGADDAPNGQHADVGVDDTTAADSSVDTGIADTSIADLGTDIAMDTGIDSDTGDTASGDSGTDTTSEVTDSSADTAEAAVDAAPEVATAGCGNGVRESGEQCDDGNTTNLDGCSSTCALEQAQRMTWLQMQFSTDSFCTENRFGQAITGTGLQSRLQMMIDPAIANGSRSNVFTFHGLDDLSGTSDTALSLGIVTSTPASGAGYDGTSDLDWWHTIASSALDSARMPLSTLPASLSSKVLTAGPGSLALPIFNSTPLVFGAARLSVSVGASSTPGASTGSPPGHLASEHLDPALTTFGELGQKTETGSGKLCGAITAASLANIPIPPALVSFGETPCTAGYTSSNSMLDLLVGGCQWVVVPFVTPNLPDTVDPAAPAAGAGGPYLLTTNTSTKRVTGCRDKNGTIVDLGRCLSAAAYSSFFKFATGRVIPK